MNLFLATSPVHMEYKLKKSPGEVLEMVEESVRQAAALCPDVEFSAEDAARSKPDFLVKVFDAAISAGASTVNIADTVGYAQPEEFGALVRYVIEHTRKDRPVVFGVHCHNDLGLAVSNSLAALRSGARQVDVTLSGLGERAGNAALEELVMALHVRKDYYNYQSAVVTEQIYPSCRMLSRIIGQPIAMNKPIVGDNAFVHGSGIHQDGILKKRETYEIISAESVGRGSSEIVLGKHSGRTALRGKAEALGYKLSDNDIDTVFVALKRLADRKAEIFDEDVEALVLEEVYRVPDLYKLVQVSVQSSDSGIPPTAAVILEIHGIRHRHVTFGTGTVDAVFRAICEMTRKNPRLEKYQVNAITGGTDAQGEVTVRICEDGITAVGRGSHADVITASARAFLNAMNRLAKQQEEAE